jgi:glycosyltransferase involved in cell wall biosynthesis
VWVLTNLPSPYQVELLSAVAAAGEIELETRFMRPAEPGLLDRLPHRILAGLGPAWFRDEIRLHPRAVWECLSGDFDCYVLSGLTSSVTFLACALVLSLRGKPWAAWIERPHRPDRRWSPRTLAPSALRGLHRALWRAVLARASRVIAMGSLAADEYHARRIPREKLGVLPYCCDVARFEHPDAGEVAAVRRRFALDGKMVLLFSGQLIERKGVDTLLAAFQRLAPRYPDAALLILGDGPLRGELAGSLTPEIAGRVHFAGRLPQALLPAYFAAADVFVFPSRHDGWGVVINEACAAGLPVIASRQTGAARDLVIDGVTGFLVERDDMAELIDRLDALLGDPERRAEFGRRSREAVERFSLANGARTFAEQVVATIAAAPVQAGP